MSRSLAEDHRRTAFFGVSPIQCTSVNLTDDEIELFKKSVRGTLQGATRVDISIERLVAGLTGKESTMTVEDLLRSTTTIANTVAKHYGSLVVNCREKPLCSYAQWSVHCRLAYRICLEKAFLSPFYTGSEIDGPADEATMKTLAAAHQAMNETVSRMREQMTLKTEESAMAKFRTTMKSAERFKRYLRMDSEGLSMLLAKVTLTTCYGIPRKGEVGYISEDEDEDPPERTTKARMGKWNEIDPIGMVEPKHHTDRGYQVPDETKSLPLGGPSAPAGISREYDKTLEAIGRKTKESIDNDMGIEQDFFQQAEGKIPRGVVDDPAYGEATYDIFESLPDELEVTPDDLHAVRSPRVSAPAHATRVSPQASTRVSAPTPEIDESRPRVVPTRRTTRRQPAAQGA